MANFERSIIIAAPFDAVPVYSERNRCEKPCCWFLCCHMFVLDAGNRPEFLVLRARAAKDRRSFGRRGLAKCSSEPGWREDSKDIGHQICIVGEAATQHMWETTAPTGGRGTMRKYAIQAAPRGLCSPRRYQVRLRDNCLCLRNGLLRVAGKTRLLAL